MWAAYGESVTKRQGMSTRPQLARKKEKTPPSATMLPTWLGQPSSRSKFPHFGPLWGRVPRTASLDQTGRTRGGLVSSGISVSPQLCTCPVPGKEIAPKNRGRASIADKPEGRGSLNVEVCARHLFLARFLATRQVWSATRIDKLVLRRPRRGGQAWRRTNWGGGPRAAKG